MTTCIEDKSKTPKQTNFNKIIIQGLYFENMWVSSFVQDFSDKARIVLGFLEKYLEPNLLNRQD